MSTLSLPYVWCDTTSLNLLVSLIYHPLAEPLLALHKLIISVTYSVSQITSSPYIPLSSPWTSSPILILLLTKIGPCSVGLIHRCPSYLTKPSQQTIHNSRTSPRCHHRRPFPIPVDTSPPSHPAAVDGTHVIRIGSSSVLVLLVVHH